MVPPHEPINGISQQTLVSNSLNLCAQPYHGLHQGRAEYIFDHTPGSPPYNRNKIMGPNEGELLQLLVVAAVYHHLVTLII